VAKPATGCRRTKSLLTFRSDTDAGLRPAISGRCLAADQSLNDRRGRFGTTFTSCWFKIVRCGWRGQLGRCAWRRL